jgi:endonuclease G, mitochondrial
MTGAGVEVARVSDKLQENQAKQGDSQLSTNALALLKEGQPPVNQPDSHTSLPEIALVSAAAAKRPVPTDTGLNNPNLAMGNPSNATPDVSNADNYLLVRDQYAMSYNKDHKTPNWVSWQLDTDWLGSSGRSGPFAPDPALPASFDKATPEDYTGSGYDRGHNCPSGDRTKSHDDNETTFQMSNIVPQTPDNNRGPWEKLESYSRELARQGKELYIIAGNEGSKGTIGNGVNVPETMFKVIVILPQKGMGAADVDSKTEVLAVEMPNVNGIKGDDWHKYITTVSAIERHTGYHFMSKVPQDIEKTLADKTYGK